MRLSLTQPQFKKLIQESIKEVLKENSYKEAENRQKLTEEKLRQTISKTVRKVIKEEFDLDDFGLPEL